MARAAATTMVAINGPALRVIRTRTGVTPADLAAAAGISRPYLTKIELASVMRVSEPVFVALCQALVIPDQRALMAHPQAATASELGDAEAQAELAGAAA